jgi:hypothetical protein
LEQGNAEIGPPVGPWNVATECGIVISGWPCD